MERRWPKAVSQEGLLYFSGTFLDASDGFLAGCWGAKCCPYANSSLREMPGFSRSPQPQVLLCFSSKCWAWPLAASVHTLGLSKASPGYPHPSPLLAVPTQLTHICGFRQGQV